MIDEIFDRNYQAGRSELNAGLEFLVKQAGIAVRKAFQVLNRIEYDAPWKAPKARVRRA